MNIKKELKAWKIEKPIQEEIDETYKKCIPYLKTQEKYETSKYKQLFQLTCFNQKKWFFIELILTISSFYLCRKITEDTRLYFLSFISILFAGLMMLECFRNLNYHVWELENSCMYKTGKVLIYKMILMSSFNILLLLFLSIYTTTLTTYDFVTVFSYGAFPFFLTSAIILDLSAKFKNNVTLAIGFIGGNILSYLFTSYLLTIPKTQTGIVLAVASLLYGFRMGKEYIKTMEQKAGGLQWN